GKAHEARFERGKVVNDVVVLGPSERRGTRGTFHPDPLVFSGLDIDYEILAQRFRELSYLNPGVRIALRDRRSGRERVFDGEGGIVSFVKLLAQSKTVAGDLIEISGEMEFELDGKTSSLGVAVALQW